MRSPVNLLVLSVGLSLALAASGTAQTPKPLRVTIPVIGMNFLPLFVAADKGKFAKEGFDVEIISTSGDGPDVDALIAGSVQFTVSTPNRLLTSYEQGKPLLAIMNMANRNAIDCVINKDVAARVGITENTPLDQKLRALKGLKVAGTRPGAFTYLVLVDYAKRAGLVPQQDLQILGVGGGPGMIAALENGQVDVACNTSPTTDLMVKRGKAIMFTHNSIGRDPAYDDFLTSCFTCARIMPRPIPTRFACSAAPCLPPSPTFVTRRQVISFRCCASGSPESKMTCWSRRWKTSSQSSAAMAESHRSRLPRRPSS